MSIRGVRMIAVQSHFITAILAVAMVLQANGRFAVADDVDTVKQRITDNLLSSVSSASTINGYSSSLNSNGSWSDVAYASTANTSWEPLTHLTRLEAMAEAYSSSSHSLYHNASLKADILNAYNYWISRNPQSSNWYYNEISVPQKLGETMVLINGILSSSQRTSGLSVLARAYESRSYNSGTNTGQNRVDRAVAGIYRGVVADSQSITDDAFAAIGDTLVKTTGDGIQRDNSFHQHGNQLYNSGYGLELLGATTNTLELNKGTSFAYSTTQQHILVDHLLDGTQWMIRGQQFDYTTGGRYVTRKGFSDNADSLSGDLGDVLGAITNYRTTELQAFKSRIDAANSSGSASSSLALVGNKQFWQSDLMTHHRSTYYASVKTSSTRTIQPESGNDEGIKNLYLGDGVNLIMRSGNEYDNIMPIWNWRRLPGTTVEQNTRSLNPSSEFGVAGTATYAGGVTDHLYGATAFKYDRYNVEAKKAWFFFDNEFVALGGGINAPNATSDVNTTLNQTLLKGTVSYKLDSSSTVKTVALGNTVSPNGLKWVFHDGIGYFFPTAVDNATIRVETRTGTWESINARYDSTSVSDDVFTLYLNHGNQFTGGSYMYIVAPGLAVGQMDAYLAANPIEVLHNSSTYQAVRQSTLDMTQAAFYSPATLSLGSGQSFSVSDPSAIIMQRSTNSLKFTAASPEADSPLLAIDLTSVKFSGTGSSWMDGFSKSATIELGLPTGDRAGDSVGIEISTNGSSKPTISFTTFDQPTTFKYATDAALALPGDTTLSAGSNKTLTFKGVISGSGSLTKVGAHDLVLSGVNTYTGGTVIDNGNVTVSGDQRSANGGWSIGPDNDYVTSVTFTSSAKISVAAGNEFRIGADTATGSLQQSVYADGTVTNLGYLTVNRFGYLKVTGSWTQTGDMEIFGKGDDSYSPILAVSEGGTFTYNGTSTIKINPSVSSTADATLIVGSSDGSGTFTTSRGFERTVATGSGSSIITLRNGGTLVLSASIAQLTTGVFQFTIGDGGGIINTNGFNTTLATPISNVSGSTGGLTKQGSGTLELLGAGTYVGATTVSAGKLTVNNTSGSATGKGAVTIASSATLSGAGFIVPNTGSTSTNTVTISGTVAPGNSAGTLTIGSSSVVAKVTTASTTIYSFELGAAGTGLVGVPTLGSSSPALPHTNHDVLKIYGTLSFNTNAKVNINSIGSTGLDNSKSYSWLIATATDGVTGTPTLGAVSGADFMVYDALPNHVFSLSTVGDNFYLNASAPAPEPTSILLIGLAGLGGVHFVRRRFATTIR